jgi:hypothetical protein
MVTGGVAEGGGAVGSWGLRFRVAFITAPTMIRVMPNPKSTGPKGAILEKKSACTSGGWGMSATVPKIPRTRSMIPTICAASPADNSGEYTITFLINSSVKVPF